jgi:hypothetical protein
MSGSFRVAPGIYPAGVWLAFGPDSLNRDLVSAGQSPIGIQPATLSLSGGDPGEMANPLKGGFRHLFSPLGRLDGFATSPLKFASQNQGLTRLIEKSSPLRHLFRHHSRGTCRHKFRHHPKVVQRSKVEPSAFP